MEITTSPARRTRRLSGLLANLCCVVVSLIGLIFLLPAAFGLERYVITGGSMTGSISRGSVVFEERVPVSQLRVGDVITYLPPADAGIPNLVTHRIHAIEADVFRTKGDANPDVDPWTFKLDAPTQPRVVGHVPALGYLFIALQDRATRITVIGVPALLVMLSALGQLLGLRRGSRRTPLAQPAPTSNPVSTPDSIPVPVLVGSPAEAAPTASPVRIPVQSLAGGSARRSGRVSRRDARRRVETGRRG